LYRPDVRMFIFFGDVFGMHGIISEAVILCITMKYRAAEANSEK
jgi:hypothetical protein